MQGLLLHYKETTKHKLWVFWYLLCFCSRLMWRALVHDNSKYGRGEAADFASVTHLLATTTYGTPEYRELLRRIQPSIQHHYRVNRHHPEHWPNGLADMDLTDLAEMAFDWKAAARRHIDGNVERSIEANSERFGYGNLLARILRNTLCR